MSLRRHPSDCDCEGPRCRRCNWPRLDGPECAHCGLVAIIQVPGHEGPTRLGSGLYWLCSCGKPVPLGLDAFDWHAEHVASLSGGAE